MSGFTSNTLLIPKQVNTKILVKYLDVLLCNANKNTCFGHFYNIEKK